MGDSLIERLDRVVIQLDGAAEAAAEEGRQGMADTLRGMLAVVDRLRGRVEEVAEDA